MALLRLQTRRNASVRKLRNRTSDLSYHLCPKTEPSLPRERFSPLADSRPMRSDDRRCTLSTQNGHSSQSSLQSPGYSLATMPRLIGFLALAAGFILAGALLDGGYQRSTPGSLQAQGTVVDFERRHSRQVYPVFEFKDADGMPHRVVNSTQQGIARFSRGDSVPIAYSRIDPERARIDTLWFSHRWVIGGITVGLAIVIRALAGPT
jgi:hypothetical protein